MIKHMKYIISGISLLLVLILGSCGDNKTAKIDLNEMQMTLQFKINDSVNLEIPYEEDDNTFAIFNGDEKIEMKDLKRTGKGFVARFPSFESYLVAKKELIGYSGFYIDSSRTEPYPIIFSTVYREPGKTKGQKKNKKYELTFSPNSENEFKGLGDFKIYSNVINATIRTETGDFRFLSGVIQDNEFTIGAIDGSHVFTFKGEIKGDSIQGHFYSGKHWSTSFVGHVDIDYELQHADSLTQVVDSSLFDFNLPDLNGDTISFQNTYAESPAIVQILGSWCPNCMDETRYYVELQKQFPELKIIGVAFERSEITDTASMALNRMKSDLAINYDLLIGGISRKSVASETFPMLNKVISFPTSIFIDKKGVIRKVHTGFNGPSTGKVYEDYKTETESFIKKLLAE